MIELFQESKTGKLSITRVAFAFWTVILPVGWFMGMEITAVVAGLYLGLVCQKVAQRFAER